MEQRNARAALVPASDLSDGLTTTILRSEIQDVLTAEEEPIELVLDVTRFSDGEPGETRNVSMKWERSDLEQLLRDAQGEQVTLTFDREALARAIADDVEAHGFREVALAIAVAATAAGGAAAAASAEPGAYLGTKAPIVESTSPDDRAVARTDASAGPQIPYLSQGQGVDPAEFGAGTGVSPDDRAVARSDASAPAGPPIPYLSQGQGVDPAEFGATGVSPDDRAVARIEEPTMSPDDRAVARSDPAAASAPADLQIPYLSQGEGVTPAELGIGTGVSPDDRALPRTDPVSTTGGTASDTGTSWAPSPETIAAVGIAALAITGAFFVIGTGRRRVRPI
jgi:hypothetical protein